VEGHGEVGGISESPIGRLGSAIDAKLGHPVGLGCATRDEREPDHAVRNGRGGGVKTSVGKPMGGTLMREMDGTGGRGERREWGGGGT